MNTPLVGSAQNDTPVAGALYSVNDGEGYFRIMKVLILDDSGVHVRLYRNKFQPRPATVDVSSLTLGSVFDGEGFGMGHMPLTYHAFLAWSPMFLTAQYVAEEELEGYRYWQDADGGIFGAPSN